MAKAGKIIKIRSEWLARILDLLSEGTILKYDEILIKEGEGISLDMVKTPELRIFVKEKERQQKGWDILLNIEDFEIIDTAEGRAVIKRLKPIELFIFTDKDLDGYTVIFARRKQVALFVRALTRILATDEWYEDVVFNIHGKEDVLRKEFGNFKRFWTKDMAHELVKSATIGGFSLEKSTDYKRYLQDYSGILSAIVIEYDDISIMLSSGGKIWSQCNKFDDRRIEYIARILKSLLENNIVEFRR